MKLSQELRTRALARLKECEERARAVGLKVPSYYVVKFNGRGVRAGVAYPPRGGEPYRLRYNPVLYAQNVEAFLRSTIPHELAHAIVHATYGIRGHGPRWRRVMTALGAPAARCHSYDTSTVRRKTRVFRYACPCRVHHLSQGRHLRARSGRTQYRCKYCRAPINFVQQEGSLNG